MTFDEVCLECISNKDLVFHWNRLTGNSLGVQRSPIIEAVDKACGYNPDEKVLADFISFVWDYVWQPIKNKEYLINTDDLQITTLNGQKEIQ